MSRTLNSDITQREVLDAVPDLKEQEGSEAEDEENVRRLEHGRHRSVLTGVF